MLANNRFIKGLEKKLKRLAKHYQCDNDGYLSDHLTQQSIRLDLKLSLIYEDTNQKNSELIYKNTRMSKRKFIQIIFENDQI